MDETEELEGIVAEMDEQDLREYNDELVAEVKDFIERNTERNSKQVQRIREDRAFAAGEQWDDKDRKARTEGRLEVSIPICQNIVSAVVNPITAKPFRVKAEVMPEYKDVFGDGVATLNDHLDRIQDSYEMRSANESATTDEATAGLGFGYATTEEKDGNVTVGYHAIEDATKVIWDADAKSITMEDAKQVVVVELIKETEAEERFGTDIWGGHEPSKTTLADLGSDFAIPEGLVPLLTYFRVEGHNCEFHRLIGEQVVESDLIEGLSRIPVIAFIGEKTWIDNEVSFTGLIHRLRPMQKIANYANSQMMERLAMSPKVAFKGPAAAIDGFEDEWAESNYSLDAYLHYNTHDDEGHELTPPEMIPIQTKVDDLQSVINGAIQQMQFATGVSPTGIVDQTIQDEATATEVLLRTKSSQSNVSHYLEHTKESVKAAGKVLAELCISVYGIDLPEGAYEIKVDGGCVDLTKMEEDRRNLLAMMQFAPENMKGVLAIGLMNTLEVKQAENLAQMMFQLLPPEVKAAVVGGDPAQQVPALQQQVAALMQQVQQLTEQNKQLTIESQQLQLRSKSDIAIKQIDAQTQLTKQKMANDNAILLKQMELQAGAAQAQFEAGVESAAQDKEIVANAQADAVQAERDLNAEITKAQVDAELEVKKKTAEEAAKAAAAPTVVVSPGV